MKKSELIDKLAEQCDIPLRAADRVVDCFFAEIQDELVRGGRVEIRGFGVFSVRKHNGHAGRNPKNGEKVIVPAKKMPFFKTGKDLAEKINN